MVGRGPAVTPSGPVACIFTLHGQSVCSLGAQVEEAQRKAAEAAAEQQGLPKPAAAMRRRQGLILVDD